MSANGVEFDYSELSEFTADMLHVVNTTYPNEAKKFVARAGNAFRTEVKARYRANTRRKTGNLIRGVNRGRPYVYNGDSYQVRVYNKAPHAHLIEHGHVFYHRGKKTDKYVKGKHIVGETVKEFDSKFKQLADNFVDDLLERGFS